MSSITKVKFKQTKTGFRAYYLQRVGGFPDRWLPIQVLKARIMVKEGKAEMVKE